MSRGLQLKIILIIFPCRQRLPSTTGSFTSFGTSLQRNQAFTTFGQQRQRGQEVGFGGQANQAFTIFGQNNRRVKPSHPPGFTNFGPSQPTSGSQGSSFTTFGVIGSPPVTPLGNIFAAQQSSLGSTFDFQRSSSPRLTLAENSSPKSFINFG